MIRLAHPIFVHATITFLVFGGLIESYGTFRRRERASRFGGILTILGTLGLVPTIVAGFLAENALMLSAAGASAVDDHERFGLIVLGIFMPLLLVKGWGRGRPPESLRTVYAAGLLVGVAAALTTAYLGGVMVYELGVGVGAP